MLDADDPLLRNGVYGRGGRVCRNTVRHLRNCSRHLCFLPTRRGLHVISAVRRRYLAARQIDMHVFPYVGRRELATLAAAARARRSEWADAAPRFTTRQMPRRPDLITTTVLMLLLRRRIDAAEAPACRSSTAPCEPTSAALSPVAVARQCSSSLAPLFCGPYLVSSARGPYSAWRLVDP